MLVAVARALEVRASLGITGVATEAQIDAAIRAAGLGLREDRPYEGRVLGRLFRRTVCVKAGLQPGERTMVKAHELGHHLCGHAGGLYVRPGMGGVVPDMASEIEATLFTFALALGEPAPTTEGLERQVAVAYEADLPLGFLLTGETLLARGATRSRRRSRERPDTRPLGT